MVETGDNWQKIIKQNIWRIGKEWVGPSIIKSREGNLKQNLRTRKREGQNFVMFYEGKITGDS